MPYTVQMTTCHVFFKLSYFHVLANKVLLEIQQKLCRIMEFVRTKLCDARKVVNLELRNKVVL